MEPSLSAILNRLFLVPTCPWPKIDFKRGVRNVALSSHWFLSEVSRCLGIKKRVGSLWPQWNLPTRFNFRKSSNQNWGTNPWFWIKRLVGKESIWEGDKWDRKEFLYIFASSWLILFINASSNFQIIVALNKSAETLPIPTNIPVMPSIMTRHTYFISGLTSELTVFLKGSNRSCSC